MKKALLLINLGTPDKPNYLSVLKYLRQFLFDKRVINVNPFIRYPLVTLLTLFRALPSSKVYKELWTKNGSPLLHNTKMLAEKLDNKLDNVSVFCAMRYQNPSIKDVLDKIMSENPDEIIIFPLFPHYASATTGSVYEEIFRLLKNNWVIPKISFINQYYDNDKFINAWINKASDFDVRDYDKIIFSYHGIPNSHVDNVYPDKQLCADQNCEYGITDKNKFCYKATVYETSKLIASKLNLDESKYIVSFQSRLTNKWLTPFSDQVLKECAKKGNKKVLMFSPAFTADCLETIIEIGDEYKELFIKNGGDKLDFVESLNFSDDWVNAIIDIAELNK